MSLRASKSRQSRNVAQPFEVFGSVRARAALYIQVFDAARLPCRVRRIEAESQARYRVADYAGCLALTRPLEQASSQVLWLSRLAIVIAGIRIAPMATTVGAV